MYSFKRLLNLYVCVFIIITICQIQNIACQDGQHEVNTSENLVRYPSPNDDGTFIEVDLNRPPVAVKTYRIIFPKYYLYTQEIVTEPVELFISGGNKKNIYSEFENFNSNAPWKILCHGFLSDYKKPFPQDLKNAYLRLDKAPNVLLVDWGKFSGLPYWSATSDAPQVASKTAQLIQSLLDEQLIKSLDHIHFIGHSLGAHIAGMTGNVLESGKLGRITGLDPAGPYYCGKEAARLNPNSAKFVDVIHTDDGDACSWLSLLKTAWNQNFGNSLNLGTADFFPNGGIDQPGCAEIGCGHGRSYNYMEESVNQTYRFVSTPCSSWDKFENLKSKNGDCTTERKVLMGEYCPRTAKGSYYLRTGSGPPYSVV